MASYKLYPVGNSERLGDGVAFSCNSDEEACALATIALKPGAIAEVWAGTRLVGKISKPALEVRNHILAGLPENEVRLIKTALRSVSLVLEQTLYEVGAPIDHVYFLESGLVSLVADTGDGSLVEVGITGRDGLVGATVLLDPNTLTTHRAIVQLPGSGFRIPTMVFRDLVDRLPTLRDRSFRSLQYALVQTAQAAACNARHELPQRLAKWLLMTQDRVDGDQLAMTQEIMSYTLGVRRAGVSVVSVALEAAGLIRQSRGKLTITDREGLAAKACSCYRFLEKSRAQIMGPSAPLRTIGAA